VPAVLLGVMAACLSVVVRGVAGMTVRCVSVVRRLLVATRLVVLGGLTMMSCRVLVVLGSLLVVLCALVRCHGSLPSAPGLLRPGSRPAEPCSET
jgi:hypothetical protein